ncbi:MAG TPA: pitrilysin family protein [Terriglobia bacterium]|nr:pitrilysin family protein [Terriglobia bacterium]
MRSWRFLLFLFALGLAATARPLTRELPPLVPPPQPVVVPTPAVETLPNGLKVVILERHTLPIVTLTLAVRAGAEADPPQLPGTAQFVASLLNEGTTDRSAFEMAEALDGAGGSLDTEAEWNDSYASLSVLSDHTRLAFDLLSDMIIRPAFAPDEVERIRRQTLSALSILRHDPQYLADTLFERIAFWGTPYSHPADGVEESIRRLTPADLHTFHARYYRPSNAILIAVGDLSPERAMSLARKFFGGWANEDSHAHASMVSPNRGNAAPNSAAQQQEAGNAGQRQVIVIDDPQAVQTEIRIGHVAISRASPDYGALTVANQVLGGPAENLLFSVLRSRRGLVYTTSSELLCYRDAGAWEVKTSTRTDETLKTVELILDQMKRLRDHSIRPEELKVAQDYLVGHMALDFETSQQVAEQLLKLLVDGLPLDYWSRYPQEIRSLTENDVWQAAREYFNPRTAEIVLVGNAQNFKKDLKKFGLVRIIPLNDVDLASATLEQPAGGVVSRR